MKLSRVINNNNYKTNNNKPNPTKLIPNKIISILTQFIYLKQRRHLHNIFISVYFIFQFIQIIKICKFINLNKNYIPHSEFYYLLIKSKGIPISDI